VEGSDGTVAVDMDPLSLLSRPAACVPPPRYHAIHYAACSRPHIPGGRASRHRTDRKARPKGKPRRSEKGSADTYRPWAEHLKRTFAIARSSAPSATAGCSPSRCGGSARASFATWGRSARTPRWRPGHKHGRAACSTGGRSVTKTTAGATATAETRRRSRRRKARACRPGRAHRPPGAARVMRFD